MRLDKYLCDMGMGTRSEVKGLIRKGRVFVDRHPALRPEEKVDLGQEVCVDGIPVAYVEWEYYMLNKPSGVVSATEDVKDATVLDLIQEKQRKDLFPVGRLDKDTEGLLFITNDGALAHDLLSPKKHVDKTYFVRVSGRITRDHVRAFLEGMDIGEAKPTLPAILKIQKSGEESEALITIREGKYHQIKRMFEACGMEVRYLRRLSMGGVFLDPGLAPGAYRRLTEEELRILKREEQKC